MTPSLHHSVPRSMREYRLISEGSLQLKVWRVESMAFILASCVRRKIPTVPDHPLPAEDGSFTTTLLCDRALFDEVRTEFCERPRPCPPRRR